jgi:hypothetical protein
MFIGLLLKNWQLVVIALLLATLAGTGVYVKILKSDIATVQAKADTLKGELEVSQASVKSLQGAIVEQNAAVDKLKSAADARVASHRVEIAKAKVISDTFKKQADDIIKAQAPQNKPKCDAANDLINQELQNAK